MKKQGQKLLKSMLSMALIAALLLSGVQTAFAAQEATAGGESEAQQTESESGRTDNAEISDDKNETESDTGSSEPETEAAKQSETPKETETAAAADTESETEAEKPVARDGEVFTPAVYTGTEPLPADIKTVKEAGGTTDSTGYYTYDLQAADEKIVIAYGTYGPAAAPGLEKKWYQLSENGEIDPDKESDTSEILLQYINISANGFKESSPAADDVPDCYSDPQTETSEHTWAASRNVYSFTDKNDLSTKYRVYGSYNGILTFYHADQYGNVAYPTPQEADLDQDEENAQKETGVFAPQSYPGIDLDSRITEDAAKAGYYSYQVQKPAGARLTIAYGTYTKGAETTGPCWFQTDSAGAAITDQGYETAAIHEQYINIAADGFSESVPDTKDIPDFYGEAIIRDGHETWAGERYVYSFSDKDDADKNYYRIYGTFDGQEGFFECDQYGNAAYPTPKKINLEEDRKNAPTDKKIEKDLVDDAAFISKLSINSIIDGTQSWDPDDAPGNDSNDHNKIVRSFDTVIYELEYITKLQNDHYAGFQNGQIYVGFELDADLREAEFDTDAMSWLKDSKVVYRVGETDYTTIAAARTAAGENGVITQVLTGYRQLDKPDDLPAVIPGTGTLSAVVKVKAMANGEEFQPRFTLWCKGNDPDPEVKNEKGYAEAKKVTADKVKVSAAPKYNIQLTRNGDVAYKSDFDFNTGAADAVNRNKGTVHGRMFGYNIIVQLYNDSSSKGLKGIELPQGEITFDVDMTFEAAPMPTKDFKDITHESFTAGDGNPLNYYDQDGNGYTPMPLLWDYKLANGSNMGNAGRNMLWESSVTCNPWSGIVGSGGGRTGAYKGGNWSATQTSNKISFTVDGYAFADSLIFGSTLPTHWYAADANAARVFGANVGCFSAGMFQVLQPLVESTDLIQDMDFRLTLEEKNMQAKSVTGQSLAGQGNTGDDKNVATVDIKRPGSYSKILHYTNSAGSLLNTGWGAGDAWTAIGSTIALRVAYTVSSANDIENYVYGANAFVKIDNRYLEVLPGQDSTVFALASDSTAQLSTKVLYVGKIGGWADEDEIQNTREDDPSLKYFENIDALNAAGYTCVGFMVEKRGDGTQYDSIRHHYIRTPLLKVTDNFDHAGHVVPAVHDVRIWNREAVEKAPNNIPSYLDTNVMPQSTAYLDSDHNKSLLYGKSTYDASGLSGGHTGGITAGNSLLLVGNKAFVEKEVEQKTSGTPKDAYDMGANQRIVDYVIRPRIVMEGTPGSAALKTTATVTDTLPKGLTYLSSVLGGTYVPNENPNKQGSITGGTDLDPDLVVNSDGTTTITWEIPDLIPGEEVPAIHLSCQIGVVGDEDQDVKNGQQLINEVAISIPEDTRRQIQANGNVAEAGISIIKLKSAALVKMVNPAIYEVGETIQYQLQYSNTGENPISGIRLLDVLPYLNDGRGTNFDGTYRLKSSLILSGNGVGAIDLYYTDQQAIRGKTAKDYSLAAITGGTDGWTKAAMTVSGADYMYTIPAGTDVTGIMMTGSMPKLSTISLAVSLDVTDNKPGNIYGNDATMVIGGSDTNIEAPFVQARVANRTITGLVWNDSLNTDGKRANNEPLIADVTVRLLQKQSDGSYKRAVDVLGEEMKDVRTAANGTYSFTNLPAGIYQVVFLGNEKVNLGAYNLTTQKAAGVPSSLNSDAEAVLDANEVLTEAVIKEIQLPKLADMKTYQYRATNQDAGLYQNEPGSLTVYKVDASNPDTRLGEMEFVLYRMKDSTALYYSKDAAGTVIWTDDETKASVFATTADGKLTAAGGSETAFNKIEDLAWGTYYIEEKKAPYGYEKLENPVTVNINKNQKHVTATVEDTRKSGSIGLEKVDAEDESVKLEGVEFVLYKVAGGVKGYYVRDAAGAVTWSETESDAFVFTTGPDGKITPVTGLSWGTYYFKEITARQGYVLLEEPVKAEINRENVSQIISLQAENEKQTGTIRIRKEDAEDSSNTLAGARFVLYQKKDGEALYHTGAKDDRGRLLCSGTEAEAHRFETAADGTVTISPLAWGTYYVRETEAPDGYVLNQTEQEVVITPENVGETATLTFTNDRIKAQFIKKDEEGNAIAGAKLAILDADGKVVESWTSGLNPHVVEGKLKAGTTYTLKEIEAPDGFLLAPSQIFTTNVDNQLLEVVMTDKKRSEEYSVKVTKYVVYKDQYRSMNYSFYTALFWDEACTERASEILELKLEDSYCTTAEFTGLAEGAYYLAETDAEGNLLDVISDEAMFTNEIDGKVINLTSTSKTADSTITNYIRVPDAFLQEDDAEITINKTVTAEGEAKKVTDTFYFTLFADQGLTRQVVTKSVNLQNQSEKTVSFKDLAFGTYYIAETDKDGVPVDEAFDYEVTVEKSDVTVTKTNKKETVEINNETDPDEPIETESETETEKPKTPVKKTPTQTLIRTTRSVKSGDNTEILLYAVILAGAALIITGTILSRKKISKKK